LLGEAEFRGEKFPNHHAGIISRELFSAVRNKIQNRVQKKIRTHDFLFRGKIFCNCGRRFVGETQKGIVYYRCHKCKKSFREELAEECVSDFFKKYKFTEKGAKFYLEKIRKEKNSEFQKLSAERGKITKRLREIDEILSGLVDMRATGEIDSQIFLERKNSLLVERAEIFDRREKSEKKLPNAIESIAKMLELIESRFLSWDLANLETKALILKMLGSNFFYLPKNTLEMRVFSFLEAYFLGDRAKWWSLSPKTRTKYEIEIVFFESALKEFTEKSF
jgi:transposase-like protein